MHGSLPSTSQENNATKQGYYPLMEHVKWESIQCKMGKKKFALSSIF